MTLPIPPAPVINGALGGLKISHRRCNSNTGLARKYQGFGQLEEHNQYNSRTWWIVHTEGRQLGL